MIKIFVHYNSLKSYIEGDWVNGRLQFINQFDVELYIRLKDVVIAYNQNGFTLRKQKWYEKLLPIKSIK